MKVYIMPTPIDGCYMLTNLSMWTEAEIRNQRQKPSPSVLIWRKKQMFFNHQIDGLHQMIKDMSFNGCQHLLSSWELYNWIMRQQKWESKTIPITAIAGHTYTLQYWIHGCAPNDEMWKQRPEMAWSKKKLYWNFLFSSHGPYNR